MRLLMAADSDAAPANAFKVYWFGWLPCRTGEAVRMSDGSPFRHSRKWQPPEQSSRATGASAEFLRESLHRRDPKITERIFKAANEHAADLISVQRKYAESAGLQGLRANVDSLASAR